MDFIDKTASLLLFLQLLWVSSCLQSAAVTQSSSIVTTRCGVDMGCYIEPRDCIFALDTCDYVLTWRMENVSVQFELIAKMYSHRLLWAAVGLNDQQIMPGASVVDCIVNASENNRMLIQMSYNHQHHNHVLTQRFHGLVNGSALGVYNGSHIICSYSRLIDVHPGQVNLFPVMNLSTPRYILLARGPTNEKGVKAEHVDTPLIARDKILLTSHVYSFNLCGTLRPSLIRLHVSIMVITWMVVSSIGITIARYMKPLLTDVVVLRKQLWFQIHRICMICALLLTVVGVLVVFDFLHWEFKSRSTHPVLGLITAILFTLNPVIALLRPEHTSPRRCIFRWVHGAVGHSVHLLAVVTMYFGAQEPRAEMPTSSKWIVVCFAAWRLAADVLLTSANYFSVSGKHNYVSLSTDPSAVVPADDMHYVNHCYKVLQLLIIAVYLAGVAALASSLLYTINISIC